MDFEQPKTAASKTVSMLKATVLMRQSPNRLAQSLKKAVGVGAKDTSSENVLSSGAR